MDRTSDGRSVMYDGIFLPVRNWATSLLKTLQLCSNTLYLSRLGTRRKKMREKEMRQTYLREKTERPDRVGTGGRAGKDKIGTSWEITGRTVKCETLNMSSFLYLIVRFLFLLEKKYIFLFYKNYRPKWKFTLACNSYRHLGQFPGINILKRCRLSYLHILPHQCFYFTKSVWSTLTHMWTLTVKPGNPWRALQSPQWSQGPRWSLVHPAECHPRKQHILFSCLW